MGTESDPETKATITSYHVVFTSNFEIPCCLAFTDRASLITAIRTRHERAMKEGDTSVRVFVFSGTRVHMTGGGSRALAFDDGTVEMISKHRSIPEHTELLLNPSDAILLTDYIPRVQE